MVAVRGHRLCTGTGLVRAVDVRLRQWISACPLLTDVRRTLQEGK